jgi:hypothetical protein
MGSTNRLISRPRYRHLSLNSTSKIPGSGRSVNLNLGARAEQYHLDLPIVSAQPADLQESKWFDVACLKAVDLGFYISAVIH